MQDGCWGVKKLFFWAGDDCPNSGENPCHGEPERGKIRPFLVSTGEGPRGSAPSRGISPSAAVHVRGEGGPPLAARDPSAHAAGQDAAVHSVIRLSWAPFLIGRGAAKSGRRDAWTSRACDFDPPRWPSAGHSRILGRFQLQETRPFTRKRVLPHLLDPLELPAAEKSATPFRQIHHWPA